MNEVQEIETGGPAFNGMTMREYFAAHAPRVPDWWPKSPAELSKVKLAWNQWGPEKVRRLNDWRDGHTKEDQIEPDELREFQKEEADYKRLSTANAIARLKADMKTVTSWRYAYADAMIQAGATPCR